MYKYKNSNLFCKLLKKINKRNRCDILFGNLHIKIINAAYNHLFKQASIFNANLANVCFPKYYVELDEPNVITANIPDISK